MTNQSVTILSRVRWLVVAFLFSTLLCVFGTGGASHVAAADSPRQVENFNRDWRFAKGDPEAAESPQFDDSAWQAVRLPHDWAISGPFNPNEPGHSAKLPWKGVGWYRKSFALDAADAGKRVYLDFDGVMAFPKVYVNGQLAGEWDYGYMSFRVDATPNIKFGESNTIAVRADTTKHGTRWYPGAGIYRKVTLTVSDPVHIGHWSTHVTTPDFSDDAATVNVRTIIENESDQDAKLIVDVMLLDPDPKRSAAAATGTVKVLVPAGRSLEVSMPLDVENPKRWDVEKPQLYEARIAIRTGDEVSRVSGKYLDQEAVTFGIREFKFTADDGFHLNGRRVQLKGVCLHHDHGPLGGAFFSRAMERQLEIMREMGVNAVRTSHNPPAPEVLDLCDRMGMVVWDECFDKWDDKADRIDGQPPLEEYGEKQIRNLVMRDRNHPSVVVWSIANEIGDMGGRDGLTKDRVKFMRDFVLKYDDTRPVGLAHHIPETANSDTFDALDVGGWNYDRRYRIFRERYPDKPILYTESASALSTRGFYEPPLPKARTDFSEQLQVDSYDYNSARWSDIPDVEFALMERDSYVAGEFVWTGFDYLGEPTPFDVQAKSSYFGIVDLCGMPKDRFYLYRSYWRPEAKSVHILPHWNWPERVGKNVPVFVYTNGDSAELFLNGKSLGRREKTSEYTPPENVAQGKSATASSTGVRRDKPQSAANGNDGNGATRWTAASSAKNEWWQVDLGSVQPVAELIVGIEQQPGDYQYRIDVSNDGSDWERVGGVDKWLEGWGNQLVNGVEREARYVRITFTDLRNGARASVRDVTIYPQSYYAVCDKFRLRWLDVAYEPGELKAVAYKNGKQIGEATMRTAGTPAKLRLTPDRTALSASGDDLCYVLVEALDADGNSCPLADETIHFAIDGPSQIEAVGNGNPLSLEPFQADYRKLFFGKAMLILRTEEGQGGEIQVTATCDGLAPGTAIVKSQR